MICVINKCENGLYEHTNEQDGASTSFYLLQNWMQLQVVSVWCRLLCHPSCVCYHVQLDSVARQELATFLDLRLSMQSERVMRMVQTILAVRPSGLSNPTVIELKLR